MVKVLTNKALAANGAKKLKLFLFFVWVKNLIKMYKIAIFYYHAHQEKYGEIGIGSEQIPSEYPKNMNTVGIQIPDI